PGDDRPHDAPDRQRPPRGSGSVTPAGHEEGVPLVPLRDAPPAVRLNPHHTPKSTIAMAAPTQCAPRTTPTRLGSPPSAAPSTRPRGGGPSTRAVTSAHSAHAAGPATQP